MKRNICVSNLFVVVCLCCFGFVLFIVQKCVRRVLYLYLCTRISFPLQVYCTNDNKTSQTNQPQLRSSSYCFCQYHTKMKVTCWAIQNCNFTPIVEVMSIFSFLVLQSQMLRGCHVIIYGTYVLREVPWTQISTQSSHFWLTTLIVHFYCTENGARGGDRFLHSNWCLWSNWEVRSRLEILLGPYFSTSKIIKCCRIEIATV